MTTPKISPQAKQHYPKVTIKWSISKSLLCIFLTDKLIFGTFSQRYQSVQSEESSLWPMKKFPNSQFWLQPESQIESQQLLVAYLVEFLTRLKNFSKSRLFIVPGWGMSPCGEERVGVEVWGLCVSVEVDLTPQPSPSAGELSGEFNGHLLRGDHSAHTHRHTHTQSQIEYTLSVSYMHLAQVGSLQKILARA